ncbi:MAG: filamentous hemagglutinin N-terminal domain-containing protein, partial [Planctomycetes bacterium]|nr:filamentous hemagglutinin N-terminal domain-containing protein [Planctomycetota bacterium]
MTHANNQTANRGAQLREAGRIVLTWLLVAATITGTTPAPLFALPTGPEVVHGPVTFNPSAGGLTIQQAGERAIINWQGFSISASEFVRFNQPGLNSIALNRVIGSNLSEIYGALGANGNIILINPHGILFGAGAQVNVHGLIASTLNLSNEDFLAGAYHFQGTGSEGAVRNLGAIVSDPGGFIHLIAPNVTNEGLLESPGGEINLAAGSEVYLTENPDGHIAFQMLVPGAEEGEAVNSGDILADAGRVGFYAKAARHEGRIQANALREGAYGQVEIVASENAEIAEGAQIAASGGQVSVQAGGEASAKPGALIEVSKDDLIAQAGTISFSGNGATVAGTLAARGGSGRIRVDGTDGIAAVTGALDASARGIHAPGGDIQVLGNRVGLFDQASVDASGDAGGGQVNIGGSFQGKGPLPGASRTFIGPDASVKADALVNGDGGIVIAWADDITRFYGNISAGGGPQGGTGGFIEVSGKESLLFRGDVNLLAPVGGGGTLLLDPATITISTAADANTLGFTAGVDNQEAFADDAGMASTFDVDNPGGSFIGVGDGATIELQATGDITLSSAWAVAASTGNVNVNVTLTSNANVAINAALTLSGAGILTLTADADASGAGMVSSAAAGDITTAAGNIVISTADAPTFSGTITTGGGALSVTNTDVGGGSLTFADAIATAGGNVTINAQDGVTFSVAASDVTTGGGLFTVNADVDADGAGTYSQSVAGSAVSTGAGNVSITADDITLTGTLTTTTGSVTILSSTVQTIGLGVAGGMTISGAELQQITTGVGSTGLTIGNATNTTLTVQGITAANSNNISGTVTLVSTSGATGDITFSVGASTFNALTATASDAIAVNIGLLTDTGALILTADSDASGTGLFSSAAAGDINTTAAGALGDVTISGADAMTIAGQILTTGGDVTVTNTDAAGGSMTFSSALSPAISTAGGILTIDSPDGITFSVATADITTGAGSVTINADSDADAVGALSSGGTDVGITTAGATGDVSLTSADAMAWSGTITTTGGDVTITNADAGGGTITLSAVVSPAITTAGGNVVINSTDGISLSLATSDVTTGGGTYTVNADTDADAAGTYSQAAVGTTVTAGGGAVAINAQTVSLTGPITSLGAAGGITITADDLATFGGSGDLTTSAGGNISVTAGIAVVTGDIIMAAGTVFDSGTGTLTLITADDVALAQVTTTNATAAAVSITAGNGTVTGGITDANGATTNIIANAAGAVTTLVADTGIGTAAASLETQVDQISLSNSTSGDIVIDEEDAGGSLQINAATNAGGGDILIQTLGGAGGDPLIINSDITAAGATADIVLTTNSAGDDIDVVTATRTLTAGNDITLTAAGVGTIDLAASLVLNAGSDITLDTVDDNAAVGTNSLTANAGTAAAGNFSVLAIGATAEVLNVTVDVGGNGTATFSSTIDMDGALIVQNATGVTFTDDIGNTDDPTSITVSTGITGDIDFLAAANNVDSLGAITLENAANNINIANAAMNISGGIGGAGVTQIGTAGGVIFLNGGGGTVIIDSATAGGGTGITLGDVQDIASNTALRVTTTAASDVLIANLGNAANELDFVEIISGDDITTTGTIDVVGANASTNGILLSETGAGVITLGGALTSAEPAADPGIIAIDTNQATLTLGVNLSATGVGANIDVGTTSGNAQISLNPTTLTVNAAAVLTSTDGEINLTAATNFNLLTTARLVTVDTDASADHDVILTLTGGGGAVTLNSNNGVEIIAIDQFEITATTAAANVVIGNGDASPMNINAFAVDIRASGTYASNSDTVITATPVIVRTTGDISEGGTVSDAGSFAGDIPPDENYGIAYLSAGSVTFTATANIDTTGVNGNIILTGDANLTNIGLAANDGTGDVNVAAGANINAQNAASAIWIAGINVDVDGTIDADGSNSMNRSGAPVNAPVTEPFGIVILTEKDLTGAATGVIDSAAGDIVIITDFDFSILNADNDVSGTVDDVQFGTPDANVAGDGDFLYTGTITGGGGACINVTGATITISADVSTSGCVEIESTVGALLVTAGADIEADANDAVTALAIRLQAETDLDIDAGSSLDADQLGNGIDGAENIGLGANDAGAAAGNDILLDGNVGTNDAAASIRANNVFVGDEVGEPDIDRPNNIIQSAGFIFASGNASLLADTNITQSGTGSIGAPALEVGGTVDIRDTSGVDHPNVISLSGDAAGANPGGILATGNIRIQADTSITFGTGANENIDLVTTAGGAADVILDAPAIDQVSTASLLDSDDDVLIGQNAVGATLDVSGGITADDLITIDTTGAITIDNAAVVQTTDAALTGAIDIASSGGAITLDNTAQINANIADPTADLTLRADSMTLISNNATEIQAGGDADIRTDNGSITIGTAAISTDITAAGFVLLDAAAPAAGVGNVTMVDGGVSTLTSTGASVSVRADGAVTVEQISAQTFIDVAAEGDVNVEDDLTATTREIYIRADAGDGSGGAANSAGDVNVNDANTRILADDASNGYIWIAGHNVTIGAIGQQSDATPGGIRADGERSAGDQVPGIAYGVALLAQNNVSYNGEVRAQNGTIFLYADAPLSLLPGSHRRAGAALPELAQVSNAGVAADGAGAITALASGSLVAEDLDVVINSPAAQTYNGVTSAGRSVRIFSEKGITLNAGAGFDARDGHIIAFADSPTDSDGNAWAVVVAGDGAFTMNPGSALVANRSSLQEGYVMVFGISTTLDDVEAHGITDASREFTADTEAGIGISIRLNDRGADNPLNVSVTGDLVSTLIGADIFFDLADTGGAATFGDFTQSSAQAISSNGTIRLDNTTPGQLNDVLLQGDVTTAESMSITTFTDAADFGSIAFTGIGAFNVGGSLSLTTPADDGTITQSAGDVATSTGNIIYIAGAITLSGGTTEANSGFIQMQAIDPDANEANITTNALTADTNSGGAAIVVDSAVELNVLAGSTGTITVGGAINTDSTTPGNLRHVAIDPTNVVIDAPITATGNISASATNNITVNANLTTTGSSSDIWLRADDDGANQAALGAASGADGTGTLAMGAGTVLNAVDGEVVLSGESVTLFDVLAGGDAGTENVEITADVNADGGGLLTLNGLLRGRNNGGVDGVDVIANAGSVNVNADPNNLLGNIDIDGTGGLVLRSNLQAAGTINVQQAVTLEADSRVSGDLTGAGGAVTFQAIINSNAAGTNRLTISTGAGIVTLNGAVGGGTALEAVTIATTGAVEIDADIITTTGGIDLSGATNVDLGTGAGAVTLQSSSGNILLTGGAVDADTAAGDILVINTTAGGNVSLGATGQNERFDSIDINLTGGGTLTLLGSIATDSAAGVSLTGAPNIEIGGNVTIDTDGAVEGALDLDGGNISGAGRTLTLDAGTTGDISLGTPTGSATLGTLTVSEADDFNLEGSLTVSNALSFAAIDDLVLTGAADTVTIHTNNTNFTMGANAILDTADSTLVVNTGTGTVVLDNVGAGGAEVASLTLTGTGAVTLNDSVFANNFIAQNRASITNAAAALTIDVDGGASGDLDFTGSAFALGAGVTTVTLVGDANNKIILGSVSDAGADSTLDINNAGSLSLSGNVGAAAARLGTFAVDGQTGTTTIDNPNLGVFTAGTDVNFAASPIQGSSQGGQSLTLDVGAGNILLDFVGSTTRLGVLTLTATGNITLDQNITAEGFTTTTTGDINLAATITVNTSAGRNGFALAAGTDINATGAGVEGLTINAGIGNVALNTVGAGTALGAFTVISSGTTTLNGAINTQDAAINFTGATDVDLAAGSGTFNSVSAGAGANILLNGDALDGGQVLAITAGTGAVTLGPIGQNTAVTSVTVVSAGAGLDLAGNVTSSGVQDYDAIADVDLTADVTLRTTNSAVDLDGGAVDGPFALTVRAGTGAVNLDGVGQAVALTGLDVNGGAITANDSISVTGNGSLKLISTGAANDLSIAAGATDATLSAVNGDVVLAAGRDILFGDAGNANTAAIAVTGLGSVQIDAGRDFIMNTDAATGIGTLAAPAGGEINIDAADDATIAGLGLVANGSVAVAAVDNVDLDDSSAATPTRIRSNGGHAIVRADSDGDGTGTFTQDLDTELFGFLGVSVSGGSVSVGPITSDEDLHITSTGSVTIAAAATASGDIHITAGDALAVNAAVSTPSGEVFLTANNDAADDADAADDLTIAANVSGTGVTFLVNDAGADDGEDILLNFDLSNGVPSGSYTFRTDNTGQDVVLGAARTMTTDGGGVRIEAAVTETAASSLTIAAGIGDVLLSAVTVTASGGNGLIVTSTGV